MPVFLLWVSWHSLTGCFGGWASCRPSPEPAPTEPEPGTELPESQTHRKSRGQEEVVSPALSPLPGNTRVDPGHQKGTGSEVRIPRLLFPVTQLPEDSASPSVTRWLHSHAPQMNELHNRWNLIKLEFFHSKGNHKQNEKTVYTMGENTCSESTGKGLLSRTCK